jgi:hypothetical protein
VANVGSDDPFAGLFLAEQSSFDIPITVDGSFIRVPIRNSDLRFEKRQGPVDREFGTDGTLKNIHFFGSYVSGTVEVYPRFDAQWWHWLMAYAMGDETWIADEWVNGKANGSGAAGLSAYKATTNIPAGFTARTLLAGESSTGHYDRVTGLIPTGWFVEFNNDGSRPFMGFPMLGKTQTSIDSSSWAAPPADLGTARVKPSDYDLDNRSNAHFLTGEKVQASLNAWGFRTLRIEYQRALILNDPYSSAPNSVAKPNKNGKNNVTVRIELDLEQIQPFAGGDTWHPKYIFQQEGESILDFIVESLTGLGATYPYAWRMNLPRIKWSNVPNPMSQAGVIPQTCEGQVLGLDVGITTRADVDEAASSVLSFGTESDVRILVARKNGDSPRGAGKTFTAQLPSSN